MAESYEDGLLGAEQQPQVRTRDQGGKFISSAKPQPMLAPRDVEGDKETGDTSDGGDDPRFLEMERAAADGRPPPARIEEEEPEELDVVEGDDEPVEKDDGQKYEVTIDGEPHEVSLQEALNGYIRQETFHKRMTDLNAVQANMEIDADNLQKGWQLWHKAKQEYEQDLRSLIPQEPDWDKEFRANIGNAAALAALHENQGIFRTLYGKLAKSRDERLAREAADREESDRRLAKYAVDNGNKFVAIHAKLFPDKQTYDKNIQSMRRTALDAGFNEAEISQVFDYRMQTVLLWASKFRRMTATKIQAVIPGKGRTLTPGSATPRVGNASRKGLDEALKRQQQDGGLDATAEVMSHLF